MRSGLEICRSRLGPSSRRVAKASSSCAAERISTVSKTACVDCTASRVAAICGACSGLPGGALDLFGGNGLWQRRQGGLGVGGGAVN